MPPLLFEEPKGGPLAEKRARERREPKRDRRLTTLKIGTLAVLTALAVGVVLLVTSGDGEESPDRGSPAVPSIESSEQAGSPETHAPTSPTPPAAMGNAATTQVVVTTTTAALPAPPPQQPTTQPTEPGLDYAVLNAPCPQEGEYSMTEQGEFVQCQPDDGRLIWQRI